MHEGFQSSTLRRSEELVPSVQRLGMRNISRVHSGYLVRFAQGPDKPIQIYYGDRVYGGRRGALEAAAEKRDSLNVTMRTRRRRRKYLNNNNRTGVNGVAWHFRPAERGAVRPIFRGRINTQSPPGKPKFKSFAVMRHGLWGAYRKTACWRLFEMREWYELSDDQLASRFLVFLEHYYDEIAARPEYAFALCETLRSVLTDATAPERIKRAIRRDLADGL